MATNSYSIANQTVVNSNLQHEIRSARFWTKMSGIAKKTNITAGGQQAWKMSGSPINIINQFRSTGRREMLIPVLGRLTGYGQAGQVAVTEDTLNWFWQSVFINLKRYGINYPDIVEQEAISWAATIEDYKTGLVEWWADYLDMDTSLAYYQGYSKHITDPVATYGGLEKAIRYSPNFWLYAGADAERDFSNSPAYAVDDTTDEYKIKIIDKLTALTADDVFNHYTLEAISAELPYSRIKGWNIDGEEVYPLVIHSSQARTLRQDSSWLSAQASGAMRGSGNPIFKNQIGRWGKILVIENDNVARLAYYDDTTGSEVLNFFDYDKGTNTTGAWQLPQKGVVASGTIGTNRKGQQVAIALLVGANSMNEGVYHDLKFTKKTVADYGMDTGVAGAKFYGCARNDAYNEFLGDSTAPTDNLPCQSALIGTFITV